eukprot:273201_1
MKKFLQSKLCIVWFLVGLSVRLATCSENEGLTVWKCSNTRCNRLNRSDTEDCKMCQTKKGADKMDYTTTVNSETGESQTESVWKCPNILCNRENRSDAHACNICQANKDASAEEYFSSENGEDATNDDSKDTTATLFLCFVLIFCFAILGGVQLAIVKQQRTSYQGLEGAPLIADNANLQTVIEVNEEEEEHRLPPDSRDYATEVCRSVCLGAVCCAAWIIVPYYHCKERRQRRRENNLTRSQELLRKLYW